MPIQLITLQRMRLGALTAALSAGCFLTQLLTAAPGPEPVPITTAELAKEMGIEAQRWRLSFDQPVVAKIWIAETTAGKASIMADAETSEPSAWITYRVMVKRDVAVKEPGAREIAIDVEGENDSQGESFLFGRLETESGSWGFKQHPFAQGIPLNTDVVLYTWERKLRRARSPQNGASDDAAKQVIEVKIRFSKPPSP